MDRKVADPLLLVGEVSEVHGAKVKVRIYSEANESHIFYRGGLVRGVSVGGYVKIPCGFDAVIGAIEGDYQQERRVSLKDESFQREAPGTYLERFVDVSVLGVMSRGKFDRGIAVLPLVRSKAYVLTPSELNEISSLAHDDDGFRVGSLAGHDGTSVTVPVDKLFASHIGVFGNTGSGKSNTLCRLYTDYLDEFSSAPTSRNRFVFIDFNGEYVGGETLATSKKVYKLNTRKASSLIPVSKDFYYDVDMWSMLTQATDRTHRPILRRCVSVAESIQGAVSKEPYMRAMLTNLLRGYVGRAAKFVEQVDDLVHLLSLVVTEGAHQSVDEKIHEALDPIELFTGGGVAKLHIKGTGSFLNSPEDVTSFFKDLLALDMGFVELSSDVPKLLEFVAWLVFVERYRDGYLIREHVTPWLTRYVGQLRESTKLYDVTRAGMDEEWSPVTVISLLDVNQDQKKVVPLVVAKMLYQEQKRRGRLDEHSSTHLVVDEAHNILSYSSQREREDWRDYRLETFEEIVKEGRKFGMYLTVCSQRPADISPTIISQMHNYFIHRLVNDEDLRAIGKAVAFIDAASMSMVPVLPQGCCIVSGTATSYPVRAQVDMLERERQPLSFDRDLSSARRGSSALRPTP